MGLAAVLVLFLCRASDFSIDAKAADQIEVSDRDLNQAKGEKRP